MHIDYRNAPPCATCNKIDSELSEAQILIKKLVVQCKETVTPSNFQDKVELALKVKSAVRGLPRGLENKCDYKNADKGLLFLSSKFNDAANKTMGFDRSNATTNLIRPETAFGMRCREQSRDITKFQNSILEEIPLLRGVGGYLATKKHSGESDLN